MATFVVIESPYAGDVERNLRYVRACMADCFKRGEIPLASHALYTQPGVLDDSDPLERRQGIDAGLSLMITLNDASRHKIFCDVTQIFYIDFGMSRGMEEAKAYGERHRIKQLSRSLGPDVMREIVNG